MEFATGAAHAEGQGPGDGEQGEKQEWVLPGEASLLKCRLL